MYIILHGDGTVTALYTTIYIHVVLGPYIHAVPGPASVRVAVETLGACRAFGAVVWVASILAQGGAALSLHPEVGRHWISYPVCHGRGGYIHMAHHCVGELWPYVPHGG